jgi:hypothetical protein
MFYRKLKKLPRRRVKEVKMIFSNETNCLIQKLINSIEKDIEETLKKKMAAYIDATNLSAEEIADKVHGNLKYYTANKET